MATVDVWALAVLLFAPLVYAVVLSPRDQPTQHLLALLQAVTELAKAIAALIRRRLSK